MCVSAHPRLYVRFLFCPEKPHLQCSILKQFVPCCTGSNLRRSINRVNTHPHICKGYIFRGYCMLDALWLNPELSLNDCWSDLLCEIAPYSSFLSFTIFLHLRRYQSQVCYAFPLFLLCCLYSLFLPVSLWEPYYLLQSVLTSDSCRCRISVFLYHVPSQVLDVAFFSLSIYWEGVRCIKMARKIILIIIWTLVIDPFNKYTKQNTLRQSRNKFVNSTLHKKRKNQFLS